MFLGLSSSKLSRIVKDLEMGSLLVLSSRWPYPAVGGEKKRVLAVLKELSKVYHVTFVSLASSKLGPPEINEFKNASGCKDVIVIPQSRFRSLCGLLWSVFFRRPFQVGYFRSNPMNKWVRHNGARFDAIYCFLARTAEAGLYFAGFKVLDLCDLISKNYAQASRMSSIPWNFMYWYEGRKMEHFERKMAKRFDVSFLVNPEEVISFRRESGAFVKHLPLGISENSLKRDGSPANPGNKKVIGFLGKMDYAPNVDAVSWFCEKVMPRLPKEYHFQIIGADPTPEVMSLVSNRVRVTGYVEDLSNAVKSCDVMIAPLRFGAGVQNKILDAWLLGREVIMSPLVVGGLGCETDPLNELIAESPNDLAEKILNYTYRFERLEMAIAQSQKIHGLKALADTLVETINSMGSVRSLP